MEFDEQSLLFRQVSLGRFEAFRPSTAMKLVEEGRRPETKDEFWTMTHDPPFEIIQRRSSNVLRSLGPIGLPSGQGAPTH